MLIWLETEMKFVRMPPLTVTLASMRIRASSTCHSTLSNRGKVRHVKQRQGAPEKRIKKHVVYGLCTMMTKIHMCDMPICTHVTKINIFKYIIITFI